MACGALDTKSGRMEPALGPEFFNDKHLLRRWQPAWEGPTTCCSTVAFGSFVYDPEQEGPLNFCSTARLPWRLGQDKSAVRQTGGPAVP